MRDAKKLYAILDNPHFKYFAHPGSLEDFRARLAVGMEKKKAGLEYNYVILYGGEMAGKVGLKIDYHRRFNAEINYFIDEKHWGKGIATAAVRLMEEIAFGKLGIDRIEILMEPKNIASKKVAIKAGYRREGKMRQAFRAGEKGYFDLLLYAKLKSDK